VARGLALALIVVLVVVTPLSGCLRVDGSSPSNGPVVPETFSSAGAPWSFAASGGCGLCSGAGGFGPHAEHEAFFVFENGRLLRIAFNERPGSEGFHLHDDVRYDAEELRALLESIPRASTGETWVVRVATARLAADGTDATLAALAEEWTTPGPTQPAADYGVHYGRRAPDGTETHHALHGPLSDGDPFARFAARMHEVERAMDEVAPWRGAAEPA
jgi:hypothetical protein